MNALSHALHHLIDEALLKKTPLIIGLDGRCGSGKTTLATELARVYDANCFHMDDFYLPFEMRTRERMASPGGNVHYERLIEEVLEPTKLGARVFYRSYNCGTQSLTSPEVYDATQITLIEGAYALHPELRAFYDLAIFVTHTPEIQRIRLEQREGEKKRKEFELRWIPLEEAYIKATNPQSICDVVLDTTTHF